MSKQVLHKLLLFMLGYAESSELHCMQYTCGSRLVLGIIWSYSPAEHLSQASSEFKTTSKKLERKLWWKNCKVSFLSLNVMYTYIVGKLARVYKCFTATWTSVPIAYQHDQCTWTHVHTQCTCVKLHDQYQHINTCMHTLYLYVHNTHSVACGSWKPCR